MKLSLSAGARPLVLGLSVSIGIVIVAAAGQIATSPALPIFLFPELPSGVAADLRSRGCGIAREYTMRNHKNVLRGDFTGDHYEDWAVLCIAGQQAYVLVYARGRAPAAVLSTAPLTIPQSAEAGNSIRIVDRTYVADHNRSADLQSLRKDAHCVEDAIGMGSSIYCSVDSQWIRYAGAD
ncbi:MAG: hypothetical protein QOJ99_5593 [Bryobacterales bacterium]|jgi:hypothetical protein|nr:hypothetical protein [Bryobacterales bacterium]